MIILQSDIKKNITIIVFNFYVKTKFGSEEAEINALLGEDIYLAKFD